VPKGHGRRAGRGEQKRPAMRPIWGPKSDYPADLWCHRARRRERVHSWDGDSITASSLLQDSKLMSRNMGNRIAAIWFGDDAMRRKWRNRVCFIRGIFRI
jgi:hypothetical protein